MSHSVSRSPPLNPASTFRWLLGLALAALVVVEAAIVVYGGLSLQRGLSLPKVQFGVSMAQLEWRSGHWSQAVNRLTIAARVALESQLRVQLGWVYLYQAGRLAGAGQWAEAEAMCRKASRLSGEYDPARIAEACDPIQRHQHDTATPVP
jgi:hypothetical protein